MNLNSALAKKAVHWLLLAFTAVFLITGFGITEYKTVEPLTLGLLPKSLAFRIHSDLAIPFVLLLVLHIYFTVVQRWLSGKKK